MSEAIAPQPLPLNSFLFLDILVLLINVFLSIYRICFVFVLILKKCLFKLECGSNIEYANTWTRRSKKAEVGLGGVIQVEKKRKFGLGTFLSLLTLGPILQNIS